MHSSQTSPVFAPIADPDAIFFAPNTRFTLLSERLVRLEYSPHNQFEDRPSQVFWYRRQPAPAFKVVQGKNEIQIDTKYLRLCYTVSKHGFQSDTLSIYLKDKQVLWRFGDSPSRAGNLLGTTRTLDQAGGPVDLEPGLISSQGWALVDDSGSLVFNGEGWLEPRTQTGNLDIYFFGYGSDYQACISDYFKVSGKTPMVPRWALGNWWSRYWAYTQDELTNLIDEFEEQQTPLSVCIIDMDWHLEGWTGYTWNRGLIPEPDGLLKWLHDKGLKTALNLHPAEGVGPHEEGYAKFAAFMGLDPEKKEPIPFDCADPKFMQAYFQILHHPEEARGTDFWWVDWQQGAQSKLPGLDPLWWLNHLHFYDLGRDGSKRPFTFSRWGGLGNHRYPIGFSGDTLVTWQALAFQPYFTATAANVGYSWWSHDIGGHMGGIEDDELYIRWVQYGVFSPILRLHSTKNPYHERRPWKRNPAAAQYGKQALQLRHALIPYIYSMAWKNHTQDIAFIRPLYYTHPDQDAAYRCPQAYWYGSELIAAPFTAPAAKTVNRSRQLVWLPGGKTDNGASNSTKWFNFFTGESFSGAHWHIIYGGLDDTPVFAPAGAIIPLAVQNGWGGAKIPDEMTIHIFPGEDNQFELYEDDGETTAFQNGAYAITTFKQKWSGNSLTFTIEPVMGDTSLVPAQRQFNLLVRAINNPGAIELSINGRSQAVDWVYRKSSATLELALGLLKPGDNLTVVIRSKRGSLL